MAESTPTLHDVFDALSRVTTEYDERGAVLYGAYAKKYLGDVFPGFNERTFGFKKFVDLLREGDSEGRFRLELVDGHPRLHGLESTGSEMPPRSRLKADLWSTMLTWDAGVRQWDRRRGRAVFVPTGADGAPLWDSEPDSFVTIAPVTMDEQLSWMREFAEEQNQDKREQLAESLDDPNHGAFKRALTRLRLQGAWTTRLQQKVAEHASSWAVEHSIPVSEVIDTRPREQPAKRPSETPRTEPTRQNGGAEAELREKLHRVIDQMSLAELAALPIPAGYFIAR